MRWAVAAGLAGCVLEGLVWMAVFLTLFGYEVNVTAALTLSAGIAIATLGVVAGIIVLRLRT